MKKTRFLVDIAKSRDGNVTIRYGRNWGIKGVAKKLYFEGRLEENKEKILMIIKKRYPSPYKENALRDFFSVLGGNLSFSPPLEKKNIKANKTFRLKRQ